MRKPVEYTMAAADSPFRLAEEVNRLLKKGWEPCGGAFNDPKGPITCQSMVRYEEVSD